VAQPWNVLYGAGYSEALLQVFERHNMADLPPKDDPRGKWIFTGRRLLCVPPALYEAWSAARFKPITHAQLNDLLREDAKTEGDPDAFRGNILPTQRLVIESGLFVAWPSALTSREDTVDALGLYVNPNAPDPIPDILPPDEWQGLLLMNALSVRFQTTQPKPAITFARAVERIVRSRSAFFVTMPVRVDE